MKNPLKVHDNRRRVAYNPGILAPPIDAPPILMRSSRPFGNSRISPGFSKCFNSVFSVVHLLRE
jgi:hypothetical protein